MRQALLLLALLAGFSPSAFAEDYYWYDTLFPDVHYQTPTEACQVKVNRETPGRTFIVEIVNPTANVSAYCRTYWNGSFYGTLSVSRGGTGCSGTYDVASGVCSVAGPTDAECKTRDAYTKIVQFSFVDGQAVISVDPEVKEQCIYEPGEPKNCTSTQCEFDMSPSGNDDMSDNPENPDQQLQDYLDELAKKFDCVKTVNGTVGCTNAQQTPPDVDPEDKCFPGYSWSGTTCVATPGGPAENNNSGGGSGGGNNGGNTGGGSDGGTNPGTGGGEGGSDGGGNSGGGSDNGTDGGDGPKETLEQPKQGSWDKALEEWDAKVEEAKESFRDKINENADQLKGVFDLNLGEGGGKLPCDTFTVWKKTVSLCFTAYEEKLSYLRYALMFMASVLAAFAILKE